MDFLLPSFTYKQIPLFIEHNLFVYAFFALRSICFNLFFRQGDSYNNLENISQIFFCDPSLVYSINKIPQPFKKSVIWLTWSYILR